MTVVADIFVMTSNGTGVTNITQAAGNDTDPSWGANGTIAFTSNRSGTPQVYTVNPDGSGLFGPLTTSGKNYYPKWNSVGNRIAFVSDRDGNLPIGNPILADADGFVAFHVQGGAFKITASAGEFERVWRYAPIGTLQEFAQAKFLKAAPEDD